MALTAHGPALVLDDPALSQGPPSRMPFPPPDYAAEADRARLEVGGDQLQRRWSATDPPRTLTEQILVDFRAGQRPVVSLTMQSRGGYERTVTGTLAYYDVEAETFMLLTAGEELRRVPMREIISAQGIALELSDSSRDAEGLGT